MSGTSALLMDARTGRVLYARGADRRRAPASTTKMLTAIIVAETLQPETVVPISRRAWAERSGAAIGLELGERWTAGELMRAMLMHSANDAAVALAEGVAGSVEAFAQRMNAKAKALGARDSNFTSPHGRYDARHYSTAYDLALIGREALRSPWIEKVVRGQTWMLHGKLYRGRKRSRRVINTNSLLWRYQGADGIKTGWIFESGPCLVASATRGDWQLIAVVLNASGYGQLYRDATTLLDYGFTEFSQVRVAKRGDIVDTLDLAGGRHPLQVVAKEDALAVAARNAQVSRKVELTRRRAPVEQGDVVGMLVMTSGGTEVGRVPVVAGNSVPSRWILGRVWQWLRNLVDGEE